MKAEWNTYRTRFLVKAKQLNSSLSFIDPLGRHHAGQKGDYLVESADGSLRIAPRQIFEDIYVPISMDKSEVSVPEKKTVPANEAKRLRRKQPLPWRDSRTAPPAVSVM